MHKFLTLVQCLAVAAVLAILCVPARSEGIPQRDVISVPASGTGEFTVPNWGNGQLLAVQQAAAATNGVAVTGVTSAVKHVARITSAINVTNTVLAAATNGVLYTSADFPQTWLVPGDLVISTMNSSTGAVGTIAIARDGR